MSELKSLFMHSVKDCVLNEKKVALALSGGKDSTAILFALLELGITPVCYSLHVEGILSTDFVVARETCNKLNLEFVEVVIPKQVNIAKLTHLICRYNRTGKVDVEVYYPLMLLVEQVKESTLLVGITAGVMMPLSKKACIHFRHDKKALNEWREYDWENVTRKDFLDLNRFCDTIRIVDPFYNRAVLDWFKGQEWDSLHKPNQKQVLINMFPEQFASIKTTSQMSLQVGDSGIREIYTPLLQDKNLNYRNRTRVNELYKDIFDKEQQFTLV